MGREGRRGGEEGREEGRRVEEGREGERGWRGKEGRREEGSVCVWVGRRRWWYVVVVVQTIQSTRVSAKACTHRAMNQFKR